MKNNTIIKKFIKNIYGFSFFNSLVFLYPVYALFMSESGISDIGISILFIIWTIGCIVSYFPISWLTNKFSQKSVVIFGQIMKMAAFALWLIFPNFLGFAIGFFIWGIQCATYDIAFESMVYDNMCAWGKSRTYAKVNGVKSALDTAAMVIATSGSLMLDFGYNFIAMLSFISLGLSVLFIMRVPVFVKKIKVVTQSMRRTLRAVFTLLKKSPYILSVMILTAALTSFMYIDDYLGLIGIEMGVNENFVGGIFLVAFIFQSLGSAISYRFENLRSSVLYSLIITLGLMFFVIAFIFKIPVLAIFGLFYLILGIIRNVIFAKFQHNVSSTCRTVALSVKSTVEQIFSIIIYTIFGMGSMMGGYRYGLLLMGSVICFIGLWALLFIKKLKYESGKLK